MARLSMTTEDFEAKIAMAKAKIDELSGKSVNINTRVNLDGLESARARIDTLARDKTVHVKVDVDQSGLSRLTGLLDKFPSIGPLPGGPAGLGVIAAGAAALLPELVAVTNGLLAAGAGATAFGALALPAFLKVKNALSDLNSAQDAYAKAQALFQLDPTKANASGLAKAADQLKLVQQQMDKMPSSERRAVQGIQNLTSEFGKMSKAFEPQAFKVFAQGLQVAQNILPTLAPMANAFATALSGLLTRLNSFTQSNGFRQWVAQFTSLIGPAVTSLGNGIAKVANAFGKLMVSFSGKDISNAMNIAFGAISGTITVVRVAIEGLKRVWDSLSQSPTLKRIVNDFKVAWNQISQIGKKKPDFSAITAAVKDAVTTAVSWLSSKMGPLVKGALKTASTWLSANASQILVPIGKAIMEGLIQGMEAKLPDLLNVLSKIAIMIAEHKGPIEKDRVLLFPHGQAIMDGLMAGMDSRMGALQARLQDITAIASAAGRPAAAQYDLTGPYAGSGRAGGGEGYALAGAGGGDIVIHNVVQLDGRELHASISRHAVQSQRRTGQTGLVKRTR